jgi:hypothetical protein
MTQEEQNIEQTPVASTLNHPQEQGSKIAPIRQCVALLWACKFCLHFSVTKAVNATIEANWKSGSSKAPLRAVCPCCKKRNRLRSENHDLVWAEVPWRRIGQRNHLRELAESLNILGAESATLPRRSVVYAEWNRIVGYTGRRSMPQPFRRWIRRGEA